MENSNFDFDSFDLDYGLKRLTVNRNHHLKKPVEQCFLCQKSRQTFYCRKCVKNGDFIHSTSRFSERFAEKRLRLLQAQNVKDELANMFDIRLSKPRIIEDKVEDIRSRKEKIKILHFLIAEMKKNIQRRKIMLDSLRNFNNRARKDLETNKQCHVEVKNMTNNLIKKQPIIMDKLTAIRPAVKHLIRRRINELVQFIFPISEVTSSESDKYSTDSLEDIKNELAEATRMAYVRGQWVLSDSRSNVCYSIVAPVLPDSGNYTTLMNWDLSVKDSPISMSDSTELYHTTAQTVSAALTYTTQLVNIIAHYLDIRLPNNLKYSEFCDYPLNERRFLKYITQLNANVLFLCLSQKANSAYLHPAHTIRNILLLLDTKLSDLGRQEMVEIDSQCVGYFEEQLNETLKEATRRRLSSCTEDRQDEKEHYIGESGTIDNEYDSDNFAVEWEALPLVACPEAVPGSNALTPRKSNINANNTFQSSSSNSIAGGLVTSAAASLASIWRGWTAYK